MTNRQEKHLHIFDLKARNNMKQWDLRKFQKSHPTLLKSILLAMEELDTDTSDGMLLSMMDKFPSDEAIKEVSDNAFPPRDNVNIPKNEACVFGMKVAKKMIGEKIMSELRMKHNL